MYSTTSRLFSLQIQSTHPPKTYLSVTLTLTKLLAHSQRARLFLFFCKVRLPTSSLLPYFLEPNNFLDGH